MPSQTEAKKMSAADLLVGSTFSTREEQHRKGPVNIVFLQPPDSLRGPQRPPLKTSSGQK